MLAQTAHAYATHLGAAAGLIVGVCGDQQATDSAERARAELGVLAAPVTTDPQQVAELAGHRGRVTVLATYASLPVLLAAHAHHDLGPWALAVIDEAHRTAGVRGAWAQVHQDTSLRAERRLYLTATPRIMTAGGTETVSMDDESVFGPQVFHLPFAHAIESGLLADYRVAVVTVTDAEVAALTAHERLVTIDGRALPARTLAMQIALSKAIRDYGLRRVITYHGRVASARKFATGLRTAIELMPADERPPHPVRAHWISGETAPKHRRRTLAHLQNPGDNTVVVSNARVLSEGVDVPALDAVMFADPRDSATDVVQAVGRALRRGDNDGKVATIIVPIFLAEGESPAAALSGSEFDTVWRVVRALRAHDERIADYLDNRRQNMWRHARAHDHVDKVPLWMQVDGVPAQVGHEFSESIMLRTVEATTSSWWEHYGALLAFHREHGHADVSAGFRADDGRGLGQWLSDCRKAYRAGLLPADRIARLEALGVDWQRRTGHARSESWQLGSDALRAFYAEHGHARVPDDYVTEAGFKFGLWMSNRRADHRAGRLRPERVEFLESFGMDWHPANTARAAAWETGLAALRIYHAAHGHARVPYPYRTPDGLHLGNWVSLRRKDYQNGKLAADRLAALDDLDASWKEKPTRAPRPKRPGPARRETRQWLVGTAALREYKAANGHLDMPGSFVTESGDPVGKWLIGWRTDYRSGALSADRARVLTELGVQFERRAPGHRRWFQWEQRLAELGEFAAIHSHANPPGSYVTPGGYRYLSNFASRCRRAYRIGELTDAQETELRTVGVDLDRQRASRKRAPAPDVDAGTPLRNGWARGITELANYLAENGTAEVPHTFVTRDGHRLGSWLAAQRRRHRDGSLGPEQITQLRSLGIDPADRRRRDPRLEAMWERGLAGARAFHAEHGHLRIPDSFRTADGQFLGKWLQHRRHDWADGNLTPERTRQLETLGIEWRPLDAAFRTGFEALRAYRDEHGHCRVPGTHVTSAGFRLGNWLRGIRQRHRDGRLTSQRVRELTQLGIEWDPRSARWDRGLTALTEFQAEHGHSRVPQRLLTTDGFPLGSWIVVQRRSFRAGTLPDDQIAVLNALGMEWDVVRPP
ncbi:DEAD/DEAH box helicase [Nocardia sp. SSK8]|uniref:DEAD/DEAH box helicase n=1 Tax=Nocardia sp. SSK8 TaxID=3120154 RepID=UPI0030093212